MNDPDRLAHVLSLPEAPVLASLRDWEDLLSQARRATLSVRLARRLADTPGLQRVPVGPRHHLSSSLRVGERVAQGMALEAERVAHVLQLAGHRCVLLKGAAYLCAGLPPARGRIFGDIDILVPQHSLEAVEDALLGGGWISSELDAYNQRYYRQWMHEIPPLTHVRRGSTIDLHHTITPPTSVFCVDGATLLSAMRPVDDKGLFWILQPVDMVLHSAVHLFAEGEFDRGLRDLLDMDDLLRHFEATEDGFWPDLVGRAKVLCLQVPLHHALCHVERLFGPRVPTAQRDAVVALAPAWPKRQIMAWLLTLALRPMHPSCDGRLTGFARWLLYVRSHWLRMPLRLLVPHLLRKSWIRRFPPKQQKPSPVAQAQNP